MKYLVEDLHVDVNARDNNGFTALHGAAARGDNEMIQYLVAHGADVKVVSRNGRTVVEICGHHLHTEPESPSARCGRALRAN